MTSPAWFPDELEWAGQEHLDPDYVEGYDRKAGFDPEPDLALLARFGFGAASELVDLGAGTGELALAAAGLCRRVVAVDVSPVMLARLRVKAERSGVTNLEAVRAGFLSYVHAGGPVDFVYSRNALHHLPDFWKAMALVRTARMLRPGGILRLRDLVFSFDPGAGTNPIEAWLRAAPPQPQEGWTRAELHDHLTREFSTFAWLLEPMLERAGFEILEAEHSESKVFAGYLCRRV